LGAAKRFGRTWALAGVQLAIPAGEEVCLLGPNGSGKSTLLRLLATTSRPTRGAVRLFGRAPETHGDELRARIGFAAHPPFLYGELTGLENLRLTAAMYGLGMAEPDLRERLAAVGLGQAAANARLRTYSQGMTQRLSLARALLHNPDLVLLDEPYTALDTTGIAMVDRLLDGLRAAGKTTVVATHLVERAVARADRVLVLRGGRLVFDGPPAALPGPVAHVASEDG
jgi:heme exporter protein A